MKPHLTGQVPRTPTNPSPTPDTVTLRYFKNLFGLSVSKALLPSLSTSDCPAHFYTLLLLFQTQSLSPFFFFKCARFRNQRHGFSQATFNSLNLTHLTVCGASSFISLGQSISFLNTEDF